MFTTPRPNLYVSDEGFSVEVLPGLSGGLLYRRGPREVHVECEFLADLKSCALVLYRSSIKEWKHQGRAEPVDDVDRDRIVEGIRSAFRVQGHEIHVEDSSRVLAAEADLKALQRRWPKHVLPGIYSLLVLLFLLGGGDGPIFIVIISYPSAILGAILMDIFFSPKDAYSFQILVIFAFGYVQWWLVNRLALSVWRWGRRRFS